MILTVERLEEILSEIDSNINSMLSKDDFLKLVRLTCQYDWSLLHESVKYALWSEVWSMRKMGLEEEIDASTVVHWLNLESQAPLLEDTLLLRKTLYQKVENFSNLNALFEKIDEDESGNLDFEEMVKLIEEIQMIGEMASVTQVSLQRFWSTLLDFQHGAKEEVHLVTLWKFLKTAADSIVAPGSLKREISIVKQRQERNTEVSQSRHSIQARVTIKKKAKSKHTNSEDKAAAAAIERVRLDLINIIKDKQRLGVMFKKIDANHNGSLNRNEFVVALSMLLSKNQQPGTKVIDLLWKTVSPGDGGELDSETFARWLQI